tara:strand:+ start:1481 stop:2017 length:537 start_codon:yes stop_codon:yes gene_type:complete
MKTKTYTIAQHTIKDVLSTLVDAKGLGTEKNCKHITDLLISLPEHSVSALITLVLAKKERKPLKIGDHVTFKPSSYSSHYDRDVMIDKKLMTEDGYVYGIVDQDGSWGNAGEFNPYYGTMKVQVYVWSDDTVITQKESVNTFDLKTIFYSDLPKFNDKSHLEFFEEIIEDPNQTKIEI